MEDRNQYNKLNIPVLSSICCGLLFGVLIFFICLHFKMTQMDAGVFSSLAGFTFFLVLQCMNGVSLSLLDDVAVFILTCIIAGIFSAGFTFFLKFWLGISWHTAIGSTCMAVGLIGTIWLVAASWLNGGFVWRKISSITRIIRSVRRKRQRNFDGTSVIRNKLSITISLGLGGSLTGLMVLWGLNSIVSVIFGGFVALLVWVFCIYEDPFTNISEGGM
jgi:hypothetical protein